MAFVTHQNPVSCPGDTLRHYSYPWKKARLEPATEGLQTTGQVTYHVAIDRMNNNKSTLKNIDGLAFKHFKINHCSLTSIVSNVLSPRHFKVNFMAISCVAFKDC